MKVEQGGCAITAGTGGQNMSKERRIFVNYLGSSVDPCEYFTYEDSDDGYPRELRITTSNKINNSWTEKGVGKQSSIFIGENSEVTVKISGKKINITDILELEALHILLKLYEANDKFEMQILEVGPLRKYNE